MTTILRIDPLTGCLLSSAISSIRTGSAIAMIDIIGFREHVNDRHGHAVGDAVLRVIGGRLRDGLAPFRIYRSGGDEFLIEIDTPMDRHDAERLALRTIDLVSAPIDAIDGPVRVDVGISLRRVDADVTAVLFRAAWAQWEARTRGLTFVIEGAAGEVWLATDRDHPTGVRST